MCVFCEGRSHVLEHVGRDWTAHTRDEKGRQSYLTASYNLLLPRVRLHMYTTTKQDATTTTTNNNNNNNNKTSIPSQHLDTKRHHCCSGRTTAQHPLALY